MYTLITGEYFVVGMSPDADSIKFKAHNPKLWDNLTADDPTKFANALKAEDGVVTIRLEGIDALETHFTPPPLATPKGLKAEFKDLKPPAKGNHHQNEKMGEQATNVFLSYMGYSNITWKRWGQNQWINQATLNKDDKALTITEKYKDAKPGYILTREAEKNGRPVGWVFDGKSPYADGTILNAKQVGELVDESANAHLIKKGVVYPYFFMTLPGAIRMPLMASFGKRIKPHKGLRFPPLTRFMMKPLFTLTCSVASSSNGMRRTSISFGMMFKRSVPPTQKNKTAPSTWKASLMRRIRGFSSSVTKTLYA